METLVELLDRVGELGTREAISFSNGLRTWVWSYGKLYASIGAVSGYFRASGIGQGDRVVLWSDNRPEWISVFWAACAAGIEVVPMDPQTHPDRVARILEEVGARCLFTDRDGVQGAPRLRPEQVADLPPSRIERAAVGSNDVLEIVYTSGTTSEPKGVIHRHRNIAANLSPVASEFRRYRRWARPFQPIRILDMLPFSHMFGQAVGIFVPPLLGGSVVLTQERHPSAILARIRSGRVSVLASVPRVLALLESELRRKALPLPEPGASPAGHPLRRWWTWRAAHRQLGWKFWALVVGGAELPAVSERFWRALGLAVVQGYGLTETSPVVTLNHPFHSRGGTLGRTVGPQEIRIAPDGEILVRGPSVAAEYLVAGQRRESVIDPEGWLHTGDFGRLDPDGRLIFAGRKKDVIVLPDGFNVHPEDVEAVLNRIPGVAEAAVVPVRTDAGDRVHAVLVLGDPRTRPEAVVQEANRELESQQRIQSVSVWPEDQLPRTASTLKLQRHKVAERIAAPDSRPVHPPAHATSPLEAVWAELGQPPSLEALSSLERVDLQAALEERLAVDLDEVEFSRIGSREELETYLRSIRGAEGRGESANEDRGGLEPPRWTRTWPSGLFRRVFQALVIQPLLAIWVRVEVTGLPNLPPTDRPVLFAPTHQSHFDVPVVLRALPSDWRRRVRPAMMAEHFRTAAGWVSPLRALEYVLVLLVFGAYPLPQRPGRIRSALAYTGELVSSGACPMVFPEGERARDERLLPFRPGIGFMAHQLGVRAVPIRIHGLHAIFPVGARWPRRGTARVVIGPPLDPVRGESYEDFAARLESVVRRLT